METSLFFYGSANESLSGYQNNYEKIRVVKSWVATEVKSIEDECKRVSDFVGSGTNPICEDI